MKLNPSISSTRTTNSGALWEPASFADFLTELAYTQSQCMSLEHGAVFRGHAKPRWRLDSTFARFVKNQILAIDPTDLIKEEYRHSLEFHRLLSSLFLCKFGILTEPSQGLLRAAAKAHLDPWFEWMKHIQQYPKDDLTNLRGTFLVDWTQDWKVALYFANDGRTHDEPGTVYVADTTEAGPILHRDLSVGDMLDRLHEAFLRDQPVGCPLIFCPRQQIACQRAKNQDAIYVAQMDLRIDLAEHWETQDKERGDGSRILLRILLPRGTEHEARDWLTEQGLTQDYIFPDKDKTPTTGSSVP